SDSARMKLSTVTGTVAPPPGGAARTLLTAMRHPNTKIRGVDRPMRSLVARPPKRQGLERPGHTRRCATVASFRTWRGSRPRVVPTRICLTALLLRRGWDSNPRYPFRYTRVPGVRLQPLGHLSSPSGERRIRTYGTVAGTPDFESGAFDHSASSPA